MMNILIVFGSAIALGILLALLFSYYCSKAGIHTERSDERETPMHDAFSDADGVPRHFVTSDPFYNKDDGFL